jgi:WD40 repeat protein/Flp pilus assembly protein TadD
MGQTNDVPVPTPQEERAAREQIIERFENAWQLDMRPAIDDYLPTGADRHRVLIELVHADLRFRLQAAEPARVEEYLERYPELATEPAVVLDLIATEQEQRRQAGLVALAEYGRRFPQYASQLDALLSSGLQAGALAPARNQRAAKGATAETVAQSHGPSQASPSNEGRRWPEIPGYEILNELGRGGMGVVYKARQLKLNRLVALKMVLAGAHAGPEHLVRFLNESEAVASLQHPHIVQVYEAGSQAGQPYFAMELVEGESLAQKLGGQPLPAEQAAGILAPLARAMHYAHGRGIVHRDLKPANVLLAPNPNIEIRNPKQIPITKQDNPKQKGAAVSELLPKVSDFSLAKRLEGDGGLTRTGAILGTPSYMAPEQASAKKDSVTPATDIYGLGAILYEMLTGRPPFRGATDLDVIHDVLQYDPVPPSRLEPKIPRDLETICLKCLAKEPRKRYASAADLAEDLRRFQAGEPIRARPVGSLERAVKWARRRPVVVALLALVFLVTLAGLAGILWQLEKTELARQEADAHARLYLRESEKAKANARAAVVAGRRTKQALKTEKAALEKERVAREFREKDLYVAHMNLLQRHWERGDVSVALDLLKRHIPRPGQPDNRGFEWYYYWRMLHSDLYTLRDLPGAVRSLAFSPRKNLLAIACEKNNESGTVLLWDADQRKPPTVLSQAPQPVVAVAFSPDGATLAFATAKLGEPGLVKLWDVKDKKERFILRGHRFPVLALAYSPDGMTLASGAAELQNAKGGEALELHHLLFYGIEEPKNPNIQKSTGELKLWNPATGKEHPAQPGPSGKLYRGPVLALAFVGNKHLVAGTASRSIKVFDLSLGRETATHTCLTKWVWSIAAHPERQFFAAGFGYWRAWGEAKLFSWKKAILSPSVALPVLGGAGVFSCAFSPSGRLLAAADMGRAVRLWDWNHQREAGILLGHRDAVSALAFAPEGQLLASGSWDNTVKLWDLASPQEWTPLDRNSGSFMDVMFSPDGKWLLTEDNRLAKVWEARTLALRASYPAREVTDWVSKDNSFWFGKHSTLYRRKITGGFFKLWKIAPGPRKQIYSIPVGDTDRCLVSGDMRYVATATRIPRPEIHLRSWSTKTRRVHANLAMGLERGAGQLPSGPGHVRAWGFTPDSKRLVAMDWHHNLKVWDVASGRTQAGRWCPSGGSHLAFSPNGKLLAGGCDDGNILLWTTADLREQAVFKGRHFVNATDITFSPDGQFLVSGDRDGHILLWDLKTREERLLLQGEREPIGSLEFAPNRSALAVGQFGGAILFRGASEAEVRAPEQVKPTSSAAQTLQWHRREADIAVDAKQWFAAAFHFTHILNRQPDDWQAWLDRGKARFELGELDKALGDFSQAITLHPEVASTWHGRAEIHARLSQWSKAAADFTETVKREASRPSAWQALALVRLALNDPAGYRQSCAGLLAGLGTKSPEADLARQAAWTCALGPSATKDFSTVLKLAQLGIAKDMQSYTSLRVLGAVQYRAGKFAEAAATLEKAARLQPVAPATWLLLAMTRHRLGQANEAKRWLDQAMKLLDQAAGKQAGGDAALRSFWTGLTWTERLAVEILRREAEKVLGKAKA